jgi:hypothetical protein
VICSDSFYSSQYDSPFEKICYCSESDNTFVCEDSLCPVLCPETKPIDGAFCGDAEILDESFGSCVYGELCCPGDNGECIPDAICYCDRTFGQFDRTFSCDDSVVFGGDGYLPCPEVCPKNPPASGDSCSIDERYLCDYGGPIDCVDPSYSSPFEKRCRCHDSRKEFECEQKLCPVTCPETKPVEGDLCAPFLDGSCDYGEAGGDCVTEETCRCDPGQYRGENVIYCSNTILPFVQSSVQRFNL